MASPGTKYRQSDREALEERARIDAAMAQLEAAKQKARAQRAEYGRYLEWKVKMQRRERKQREQEEAEMRARIDEKLRAILHEHREQKHKDRVAWTAFANNKVPKAHDLHLSNSGEREREYMAAIEAEQERKREEIERSRMAIREHAKIPKSAPSAAAASGSVKVPRSQRALPQPLSATQLQLQHQASFSMGRGPGLSGSVREGQPPKLVTTAGGLAVIPHTALAPATAAVVAGVKAAAQASRLRGGGGGGGGGDREAEATDALIITPATERVIEDSHLSGQIDLDVVSQMTYIPEISPAQQSQLSLDQQRQLEETSRARQRVAHRRALVEGMYDQARKARLYATSRMLADPPADFMIGHDVMRYIPADLLSDGAEANGGIGVGGGAGAAVPLLADTRSRGDEFFMTQVDGEDSAQRKQHSRFASIPSDPLGERDVGHQGASGGPIGSETGTKTKQLLWKKFDPNAWMRLPERPPVQVVQERIPEEEDATLEWYKTYHEKYTRVKKRTESTTRPYNWSHQERHVLPKLRSTKFDED